MPVWAPDGSALFFVDPLSREMLEVEIDTVSGSVVQRTTLFTLPDHFHISPDITTYDIHPDGQRFLMVRSYESEEGPDPTLVVLNWFSELRRLVPN